mgnify:FL=1
MYEIYCKLRDKRGVRDADVSKATGISKSTFSDWKSGRSNPKNEKLKKIADYFGVTIKYLMTGKEDSVEQKITSVSPERALDIEVEHDVDAMMEKLKNGEEVVFRFNGDTAGDEDMELIKSSLMNLCMTAKRISKQKE